MQMSRNVFDELRETLDRLAEQFPERERESEAEEERADLFGTASVDVGESDDAFTVTADLPGFDKSDIDVSVQDNVVHIRARHETESEEESGDGGAEAAGEGEEAEAERYIRRERTRKSVSRTIRLPADVQADEATAEFNNGVLTITLPKAEEAPGQTIEIE